MTLSKPNFLLSTGYAQFMNDHSLFINSFKESFTTLLVYVKILA